MAHPLSFASHRVAIIRSSSAYFNVLSITIWTYAKPSRSPWNQAAQSPLTSIGTSIGMLYNVTWTLWYLSPWYGYVWRLTKHKCRSYYAFKRLPPPCVLDPNLTWCHDSCSMTIYIYISHDGVSISVPQLTNLAVLHDEVHQTVNSRVDIRRCRSNSELTSL